MMFWVVCGARRGVGKTWLCRELARALPQAVYAKVGHNPCNETKGGHYFTSVEAFMAFYRDLAGPLHCIVESNRPELRSLADVRVFIAAPPWATDVRPDAEGLRRQADVRIGPHEDAAQWESAVASKLNDPDLARQVCDTFDRQRQFICGGRDSRRQVREHAP